MRDAAIQAIAVRAYNLQRLTPPVELSTPELEANLIQLASDWHIAEVKLRQAIGMLVRE